MKNKSQKAKGSVAYLLIAIFAILAIFAVFAAAVLLAGNKVEGTLTFEGNSRRGSEQIFTYENSKLKQGDEVKWFVGNECRERYRYDGQATSFSFTPTETGETTVTVVAGKYTKRTTFEVQKPLLKLSAKDVTIHYGEQMPRFELECEGLLEGDSLESLGIDSQSVCAEQSGRCGTSKIKYLPKCDNCDYEVQYTEGNLTVLPKELHIANVIEKIYDQTDFVNYPAIVLEGVCEGDEVFAICSKLYFGGKNVGEWQVDVSGISLEGSDGANYVLSTQARGRISPRRVILQGLTVSDKPYDGTTKATVAKLGKLQGILDGDSVAIGSLDVHFSEADVGTHPVIVKSISLVGLDKDNYILGNVSVQDAQITAMKK